MILWELGALLNLLGSGVGLIGRLTQPQKTPVEGASFAELLDRVSGGGLRAGEPVLIDPAAGVDLSPEQLTRIGEAADRLESAGASRGVIMVDDLALGFDVLARTVTGRVDLASGEAVAGIDAVVRAPAGDETPRTTSKLPGAASMNRSLLELLAERGGLDDAA